MYLSASTTSDADGLIDQTRAFIVLAFVTPEVRTGSKGQYYRVKLRVYADILLTIDMNAEALAPLYPVRLTGDEDLSYEVTVVPVTSFALVTKYSIKVCIALLLIGWILTILKGRRCGYS